MRTVCQNDVNELAMDQGVSAIVTGVQDMARVRVSYE